MAKRVRGQRSAHRSGGQAPPLRRSSETYGDFSQDAASNPDIDAAIDSVFLAETELAIEEPSAPAHAAKPRRGARVKADSLDARIAAEQVYVRDDLRRILTVSAILFAALGLAWFVFVFLNVLGLY